MPETSGVAMLVPSLESYPLSASGRSGCPGSDGPVAAVADMMPDPYEVKSGLSSSHSSSSPSSSRGPQLE